MRKILITLACVAAMVSSVSADFVRVEGGAGIWQQTSKGDIDYTDSITTLTANNKANEDTENENYVWLMIKHPIPIVPNLRLEYVNVEDDGLADGKFEKCSYCQGRGEIYRGNSFMRFAQTCPRCEGEGSIIKKKCKVCQGKKQVKVSDEVEIKIPAGINKDHRLRIQERGHIDSNGNRGDLYITFNIENDKFFKRHGNDIYLELPLFFTQAILGETIQVPALKGSLELKLKPGTRDKQQYVFRGEGVSDIQGYGKGDLIVQIKLIYPEKLTNEQKELLMKLQESFGIESKQHETLLDKIKNWFNNK